MRDMWDNGLIDPNILTQDAQAYAMRVLEYPFTVGMLTSQNVAGLIASADVVGADDEFIGIGPLTGPHGDRMWNSVRTNISRVANFVITDAAQNVPVAVEFIDFFMDQDNMMMWMWGEEGTHWYYDEDGQRARMDWINNDPQGRSQVDMLGTFLAQPGGHWPGIIPTQEPNFNFNMTIANEMVMPYVPPVIWEPFNFTEDELRVLTTVGQDVRTFVVETLTAFIIGTQDIETGWDEFLTNLDRMGLQQLIGAHQAAYDRFLAAGGPLN